MKTPLLLSACLAAALLFAGCVPESINPLSTPATSAIDGRFEGVYQEVRKDKDSTSGRGYWHFHYRGASDGPKGVRRSTTWLEIAGVGHEPKSGMEITRYKALAVKIAGQDYLSFSGLPQGSAEKSPATYNFARYEVNWRGNLRVWLANESAFVAAVKAGKLRGKVTHSSFGDSVKLTDTTAHLAAFIAASDFRTLFNEEPMIFRRLSGATK